MENKAKVCVGTYNRYNAGMLDSIWVELDEYGSKEDFINGMEIIFQDVDSPEFMYQDWENVPSVLQEVNDELFEYIEAVSDFTEERKEGFDNFITSRNYGDLQRNLEVFEEVYEGKFDSEIDFTKHYIEVTGLLEMIPENLRYYFNTEAYCRDLFIDGYWSEDGHIYRNY